MRPSPRRWSEGPSFEPAFQFLPRICQVKLALSDGCIGSNPAAELIIPKKCKAGRDMRPLTIEEVNKYLEVFDLREKLIARLAIFEGMRPGERRSG